MEKNVELVIVKTLKGKKMKTKPLTDKEKLFAKLYVENLFSNETQTNTDIAIQSGYAKDSAHQRAYENTTYRLKPHVVKYIEELKEDFRARNQITPEKHMARLNELHEMAKNKEIGDPPLSAQSVDRLYLELVQLKLIKKDRESHCWNCKEPISTDVDGSCEICINGIPCSKCGKCTQQCEEKKKRKK